MLKKIIIPLFSLLAIWGVQSQPRRVVLDKVVAVVGNSSILYSEVKMNADALVERRRAEGYTSDQDPMIESLETLMENRLLANQARIDSIEINHITIDRIVNEHVDKMVVEAGGIAQLEREQSMKLFVIRENIRNQYVEQSLAQNMQSNVLEGIKIVPGEVAKFYKSMDRDKIPMIGDQYAYAQITKFPNSMEEAKRRVKERLLDMRQRVVTGETRFSVLAQMYSVDPGSAYRGGEMAPQELAGFVAPFADALESLRPGQISEIVETEFGFHIIELIDKNGHLYHCRHILLRPVYTNDELNEPTKFLDSIAMEIKRDSITFEAAAKLYSDDSNSKMNGGIVSNYDMLQRFNAYDAKLTVTRFLREDFGSRGFKSLDDLVALDKLKVGEVSQAYTTEDLSGNQLSKIVKLVESIPAHEATLEQDYLRLETVALEDKKERVYEEWLTKHIQAMYVFVIPEFRKSSEFKNKMWLK